MKHINLSFPVSLKVASILNNLWPTQQEFPLCDHSPCWGHKRFPKLISKYLDLPLVAGCHKREKMIWGRTWTELETWSTPQIIFSCKCHLSFGVFIVMLLYAQVFSVLLSFTVRVGGCMGGDLLLWLSSTGSKWYHQAAATVDDYDQK